MFSEIHNLNRRIINEEKNVSPYVLGISRKAFEEIRAILNSQYHTDLRNRVVFNNIKMLEDDIFAEQLVEEARQREKLHRSKPYIAPYPIMVITHDDRASIEARIYVVGNPKMSKTFSVTYGRNYSDESRANAMRWLKGHLEAARADAYDFFRDDD